MPAPLDLTGQTFGRLVAESLYQGPSNRRAWTVLCACGTRMVVQATHLVSGHTKSCGCLRIEVRVTNGRNNLRHGRGHGKGDATYRSWTAMRERGRSTYNGAKNYADRGITVCSRWDSFEHFLSDMGERPDGTTLDRIDVNGNYEPANCRWAADKVQQRNRRNTNYLEINGVRRPSAEVAEDIGVSNKVMKDMISVSRILTERYGTQWQVLSRTSTGELS